MRLLYVVHQFFPEAHSGTEQYALAAAREGRRRGHDVVVLSLLPRFDEPDPPVRVFEERYEGFRVIRFRWWDGLAPNETVRDFRNPFLDEPFRGVLAAERPDAVHFFHLRHLDAGWIDLARSLGARTVVHLMDFWYVCPKFILLRADDTLCEGPPEGGFGCIPCVRPDLAATVRREEVEALARSAPPEALPADAAGRAAGYLARPGFLAAALGRAHAVLSPSRFARDLVARNGVPASRIEVVPYGLDPDRIRRTPLRRPRAPLRVAFMGVLSPWKGADLLVEAVRRAPGPLDCALHARTDEYMFRESIARLRARAEGDARIRFPGAFDGARASEVFADTDLLVVPSRWHENTPFVALEALAAGVPVAGARVGGIAEIVEEGRNGFLFERGDADALASVLRRCLDSPDAIARLRPEPLGWIGEAYDRFEACYRGGA